MNQRLDFINSLGLTLNAAQLNALLAYADLVWEKKETLNLTSVKDKQEIWDRHILDGLAAASLIKGGNVADYGAGAGYIGISIAAAVPAAQVSLIESIEKRCMFMEWVVFKLGLKNVKVLNIRAGARGRSPGTGPANAVYDFTTERAMGQIDDILPACTRDLKPGGLFIAYQAADSFYKKETAQKCGVSEESVFNYVLPGEDKQRKLVLFRTWIQQ